MNDASSAPRLTRQSAETLVRAGRWAFREAWFASGAVLVGTCVVAALRAFIPAALAITARGLVNAAIKAAGTEGASLWPMAPWLVLGFVFTVMEGLAGAVSNYLRLRLRDDLNAGITADILDHAAKLEVSFYEDPRQQDILQRAKDNPAGHIAAFLSHGISSVSNALQIASLLSVLLFIEPFVVVIMILFTLPYLRFQWRLAEEHFAIERSRTTKRRWTNYFVGTLTGGSSVAEIKLLRLAPLLVARFRSLMGEFRDQDRLLYSHGLSRGALFVVVTTAAFYTAFVRVAWRVLNGALTVGDLAIFGAMATRLRLTLENFVHLASEALAESLFISNVMEFLQAEPRHTSAAVPIPADSRAEIELRQVTFHYPGAAEPALVDLSLRIEAGETIALVGENGAGKTTLVKLIAGLYDAQQGLILFDGVDVRSFSREDLHRRIAFVFQGFGRYEASAADNIAYGDWQALLHDRARVEEIARLAGVDAMIATLPRGYDTLLGRGFGDHDLSAGQWQKLAVARAFANDADLLILDEPTSNLDARAEHALFAQFQQLAHGRTTIIVSHRFSTVSMANRIVVLEKGRIVEVGTHDELMRQAGNYANLYELHQRTRLQQAG